MKKVYHYSREKFLALPLSRRLRIFQEILEALFANWQDIALRHHLIASFLECLSFQSVPEMAGLEKIGSALPKMTDIYQLVPIAHQQNIFLGDDYKTDQQRIRRYDGLQQPAKFPLVAVLTNLRSAFNVGSIFRSAECVGVEKLFLCGHTPVPLQKQVADAAMGTTENMAWEYCDDLYSLLAALQTEGYTVYALETSNQSLPLYETETQFPAALVLGNEALGLEEDVISACDATLEIPVYGWKNSLNVAVAFAVAGYELRRQYNRKENL